MLETEIKKLREAIEALTAQMQSGSQVVENIEDTIEEPKLEVPDDSPEPGAMEPEDYTVAACKALAREKIVAGMDKAQVKKFITELGGDGLSDLDDEQRKKFIDVMEQV